MTIECYRNNLGAPVSTQVYNFNIPTFGPGVVYDVDIKVRNEQFRWLGEALKGKKLLSYIPGFVKEAQVSSLPVCSTL